MALQVTPVNRNLQNESDVHVFWNLKICSWCLGRRLVMNIVGHFVGGEVAGMPMNLVLQYGVPLFMVPVLMAFKYGKPRGVCSRGPSPPGTRSPTPYCCGGRETVRIRSAYLREE